MTKTELLKTIRAKCMDCSCGQIHEVRLCPCEDCPLWPFRLGKDPFGRRELSPAQKEVLEAARKKAAANRLAKKL